MPQDAQCFVTWKLDGRKTKAAVADKNESGRGYTRRLHLGWRNKRLKDAYLVFAPRERYTITPSDAQRVYGEEQLFMGRMVETDGSIYARIKSWLDLCKTRHRSPCDLVDLELNRRFENVMSHSYFGVVDVQNMQLVGLPAESSVSQSGHPPFAALSYVWGRSQPFVTNTENVSLLRTHGGIEKVSMELPTVIKDSIDLTRRLGLQYIWIDALCIIQDSPRSWKLNAENMDVIYGSAELTICAADGEDASAGLRATRKQDHNNKQEVDDCAPGVRLVVSRSPEMYIKASKWNTRAWTFQERLLSNRCLIFTAGRVYFQCRSTGMSEDIYADRQGVGWSLDFVDAPAQMFKQLSQRAFWVYTKTVTLYTGRDLTNPEDILAAFSGMRNIMKNIMNAPFIFGLPSSHFDLALLWQHTMPVTRREKRDSSGKSNVEAPDFPSWCWSGWQGAATAYLDEIVGECLDNANEWLDKRTWIKWHVRDGRGDLRPLWDACKWKVDSSEDKRWKGYKTKRSAWPESMHAKLSDEEESDLEESDLEESDDESSRETSRLDRLENRLKEVEIHTKRRRRPRFPNVPPPPTIHPRRRPHPHGAPPADVPFPPQHVGHAFPPWVDAPVPPPPLTPQGDMSAFYNQFFEHRGHISPEAIQANPTFNITLRDYPYNVVMADFDQNLDTSEYPLRPILQFWTHHTFLNIRSAPSNARDGLVRCHIGDSFGDWCGSVFLDGKWVDGTRSARQEFIAISEAKKFTREECETWTYYIPKEREESESDWDLYYVLLIERKDEKWERVGLGKVFKAAFRDSTWKEIMLS
ncbi:MAG: hypothetical protein Q9157_007222 [Trypethelium eluteriae]